MLIISQIRSVSAEIVTVDFGKVAFVCFLSFCLFSLSMFFCSVFCFGFFCFYSTECCFSRLFLIYPFCYCLSSFLPFLHFSVDKLLEEKLGDGVAFDRSVAGLSRAMQQHGICCPQCSSKNLTGMYLRARLRVRVRVCAHVRACVSTCCVYVYVCM